MRKITMVVSFAVLLSIATFAADESVKSINDFTLPGTDDKTHSLSDYKDAKAVVAIFVSTACPVSNAFNARMAEMASMYQDKGFVFLGINSNKAEKMDDIKQHAKKNSFPFVVLKDENNIIADQFKAKVTPEVFVLSGNGDVLYHGRIDDSANADERKSHDLKSALDDIVADKDVNVTKTKAFGCTIKRVSM